MKGLDLTQSLFEASNLAESSNSSLPQSGSSLSLPLLKSTVILCYRENSFELSAQAEHNRGRIRRTKLDRLTPAIAVDPS